MKYNYLEIPKKVHLKLLGIDQKPSCVQAIFQPASEPSEFGKAGKSVGDILFLEKQNLLLVSLGPAKKISADVLRQAGGSLIRWLTTNRMSEIVIDAEDDVFQPSTKFSALLEGILLASYRFERHKKSTDTTPNPVVWIQAKAHHTEVQTTVRRAETITDAINLARDWAHEPANVINPVTLAERSIQLAEKYNLEWKILDEKELEAIGAGAIVSVGKGSHQSPARLIILKYAGKKTDQEEKPVVLVGKGLTFDTGGYSLKDTANIQGMKYDKCGAMAVIGTIIAAAQLEIPIPIIAVIGAAENMISSYAYRPDDILTTLAGKTVEIVSTDAEGRLVLADTLTYVQQNFPARAVIDLATLTGGVVVALGRVRAGLLSNNDRLANELLESGERTHERLWRLPLDEEYFQLIKSEDGDMKNSSTVREAHPIVGGIFLSQFIDETTAWAHLDIAGVADSPKELPYSPKGATGFGVRLLIDYLENLE